MSDVYCALAAVDADEPLIGSAAAETEVWLLLEHERVWAAKPLDSEGLDPVRAQLRAWDAAPRHRLQLIRQPERSADGPVRLYVGRSAPDDAWLVAFDLDGLAALSRIDLDEVVRAGGHPDAVTATEPIHLVCTHGKRDRCCAKWGMPVYQAMAERGPGCVWQTSHTGGHRFAANVISFPHGVSYGRVEAPEGEELMAAHRVGCMHSLDRLRGRTCFDAPTQTAEHALRRDLGRLELDALRHLGTEPTGDATWRVRFEVDGATHALDITCEDTGRRRPKSCGDEPSPILRYRVS